MKIARPQILVAAALIWALTFVLPVANAKGVKLLVSWKNPDYSGKKPHRILVIGMSENPEIRADFEDDLSSAIVNEGFDAVLGNLVRLVQGGSCSWASSARPRSFQSL